MGEVVRLPMLRPSRRVRAREVRPRTARPMTAIHFAFCFACAEAIGACADEVDDG